jgi:perosamine synthetase
LNQLPGSPEPGAPAPEGFIPLSVPHISGNAWAYVKQCLDEAWVSAAGGFVGRFEEEMAGKLGVPAAVATTSGTSALHAALLVSGIEPDDEVIVSDLTFIAPAFAIRHCGAWPVLMDAEPEYWQIDPGKLAHFLDKECTFSGGQLLNKSSGRKIKAVMPVHILGHPVDLDPIISLCDKYGLKIIEDACESLGASYKDKPVGATSYLACLSFNGNKLITTGGGGMVLCSDAQVADNVRHITTQAKSNSTEYVHDQIGYNYRLTNLQAALGCAQLEAIDQHLEAKRRIARTYYEGLAKLPGIILMPQAPWASSSWWLYTVLIDQNVYGQDRRQVMQALHERKIQTRPFWQPLHLSPAMAGCQSYYCENTYKLWEQGLSLPCSVGLNPSDQAKVIEALSELAAN